MQRKAILVKKSIDGKKAFFVDERNAKEIYSILNKDEAYKKKFRFALHQLLDGKITRDLYDKENFEKGCEHITALKLFKGKNNPRIYCQEQTFGEQKVFVIIACSVVAKKTTSSGLSKKDKQNIRSIAKYEYDIKDI
ncbi:MAG: hypothetical protein V4546_08210 [Bacteroidota bacterium]|uniref:Uncharacterized protein n=1 Tax=Pedobacter cryotolerans TaxID=2571270 RepID=A0A4U1C9I3_9SPHI|nr:hypothetical protein [Pedobacter cryotolerans]TKC01416.1 hypothetical protein FA045_09275 [Pedobacter cryotolerans]